MILQALTEYYRTLCQRGELPAQGWSEAKISFELYISPEGELQQVIDVREPVQQKKKTVLLPKSVELPAPVKRSNGVAANFLWDHSGYLLGVDSKGKPQRAKECFDCCKALHEKILQQQESAAVRALLGFFRKWDPEQAPNHPALAEYWQEILAGGNLTFRWEGGCIQEDPLVRAAWERHFAGGEDGVEGVCLVTGEKSTVLAVHPSIKNVAGAQPSGAALVSFNEPAFRSYGKKQSFNAPVSKYAAFAYTSALNYLLANKENVYRMGDTTVVCWAKGGEKLYQNFYANMCYGVELPTVSAHDLQEAMRKLCAGEHVTLDGTVLDPDMEFFVLGISPNSSRLSVRFFLRNSFGDFLRNVQAHHERLRITRPVFDPHEQLPLWRLMGETVNQNARDKSPTPGLSGEVLRSILLDLPYPATLINGVMLRITAEKEINRAKAAIIKAYYLKNTNPQVPKEVLTVSLNPDSTNIPYTLGRLFSVLEDIQLKANPGINATIKDKYFNAASATPARIFPVLLDLAQKHLRKLEVGPRIGCNKQLQELLGKLGEQWPGPFNLAMKGAFQLGYYHQTQKRYEKKEDK